MSDRLNKLTVRLTPNQMQVLDELHEALGCPISLLVRAMILSFITTNEPIIDSIVEKYHVTGQTLLKKPVNLNKLNEEIQYWDEEDIY